MFTFIAAAALAAQAQSHCAAIPGADALWARKSLRWIVVGELHGTREEPAAFGDVVCLARAAHRPIVVAVEQPEEEQPAIDSYMASDGGPAARTAFLKSIMWQGEKDGRSSQAYFDLFDRLRLMRQRGAILGVAAFQPGLGPGIKTREQLEAAIRAFRQSDSEKRMAALLRRAAGTRDALVLALVGNFHALKARSTTAGGETLMPAAALLPPEQTLSLYVAGSGGSHWVWDKVHAGVHPAGNLGQGLPRRIRLDPKLMPGYDGMLSLGTETSASLPAADSH